MIQPVQYDSTKVSLTEAERHQLLFEWNDTQADYPKDTCIHQLFEAQVERTPDAVAVVFEGQQLTYKQLNCRANQLAHYLQKLGVGPEVLIGICMERSLDMIVGLLGILKAGGAYVPLDPTYPLERLAFMLEDAQVSVLLTQERLLDKLPTYWAQVICLDVGWDVIVQECEENLISETTPDNLVYVIYTSGSTGKPKGVQILHRGLVNYLTWCISAYAVELGVGTLVHSSIAFDLTITALFSPLLVGRRVELLPDDFNIEGLGEVLRKRYNLSLVKITPAHLLLLSQQLSPSEAAGKTRALIIGGENLLAESITFWQDFAPETMLINEYGPTETVVGCCTYQVTNGEQRVGSIPIGRPIANTQLYILNEHLQPVPIGVAGELYIGGVGVARGYLNRPELTAEKFIPNPFSNEPRSRLYKTGDLAHYLPDGNIEFLGRIDHQVKIRGFRIELGEIEAVLAQHPAVKQSVVLAKEDIPGDKRLVAYVNLYQGQTTGTKELHSFLKSRLPHYMMPSTFVLLDALPLTPNGKVDRHALPTPDYNRTNWEETFVAPRTPTEQLIADIWAKVLGLERISVKDNFLELGGHSLLATQIIAQMQDVFQLELSFNTFFQNLTIASLSSIVTRKQGKNPTNYTNKIAIINQVNAEQILGQIEQLSDEEVDSLLKDILVE
jgi:amino acid adenylation domain-containing protein